MSRTVPVIIESRYETTLAWRDEFTTDLSQWYQDTMNKGDALHRTGYKHLELDGTVNKDKGWQVVPGRWAALYDEYRPLCQFIRDDKLVMKGYAVKVANPYRKSFVSGGVSNRYAEYKLYAAWLSTWSRRWSNSKNSHVTDPNKTSLQFSKGSIIETRVNFEAMCMRGHRWSFWLMPSTNATKAYDRDVLNGVEVDCPEVENPVSANKDYGYNALLKIVGGAAGDTKDALKDLRKFDINLRKGWHTFTTAWEHSGKLKFYVDGKLINQDDRPIDTKMYLVMSREMNSGRKTNKGPHLPIDPGLTGQSVILDVDKMETDEVLIDYVRVWSINQRLDEKTLEDDDELKNVMEELREDEINPHKNLDDSELDNIPTLLHSVDDDDIPGTIEQGKVFASNTDNHINLLGDLYEESLVEIDRLRRNKKTIVRAMDNLKNIVSRQELDIKSLSKQLKDLMHKDVENESLKTQVQEQSHTISRISKESVEISHQLDLSATVTKTSRDRLAKLIRTAKNKRKR